MYFHKYIPSLKVKEDVIIKKWVTIFTRCKIYFISLFREQKLTDSQSLIFPCSSKYRQMLFRFYLFSN